MATLHITYDNQTPRRVAHTLLFRYALPRVHVWSHTYKAMYAPPVFQETPR